MTIYYAANGQGYLIISSQGTARSKYTNARPRTVSSALLQCMGSHTDGIDVINVPLPLKGNPSQGLFALHNGRKSPYPVEIVSWENIV